MRRSILNALTVALIAGSTILFGCKSESQTAVSASTSAPQTQPSTPVSAPAQPAAPTSSPAAETAPAKTAEPAPVAPVPVQSAPTAPAAAPAGVPDLDPKEARGSKSAPIVMETFSDYQCPACKQVYLNSARQLIDTYVATGKVYWVHRDFPLPMHAYSRVAARYSRAAAQIGKLEQAEQTLFENQEKWEQTGDVDGTLAKAFSAPDMNKIRTLTKNPTIEAAIEKDLALGRGYGVNSTPTSYVHYKGQTYPLIGIVNYDNLRQFLDQLLSM